MQVVVWKSPKCLSGILRAIFKIKKAEPMQARLRKTGGARDENARWEVAEKRMLSAVPRTGRFCFFRIHRRTASYR